MLNVSWAFLSPFPSTVGPTRPGSNRKGNGELGRPALVDRSLGMHHKPRHQGASSWTPSSLLSAGRDAFRIGLRSGVCAGRGKGRGNPRVGRTPQLRQRRVLWRAKRRSAAPSGPRRPGLYPPCCFRPQLPGLWGQGPACPVGGSPEARERRSLPRRRPGVPGGSWSSGRRTKNAERLRRSPDADPRWDGGRGASGWRETWSAPSGPSLFLEVSILSWL